MIVKTHKTFKFTIAYPKLGQLPFPGTGELFARIWFKVAPRNYATRYVNQRRWGLGLTYKDSETGKIGVLNDMVVAHVNLMLDFVMPKMKGISINMDAAYASWKEARGDKNKLERDIHDLFDLAAIDGPVVWDNQHRVQLLYLRIQRLLEIEKEYRSVVPQENQI